MAFNDEIMVASGEAYDPEHPSTEKATLENVTKNDLGKAYTTDDSTSTTINDTDYVPMSDASGNRKKSLWSNIVSKIKSAIGIAASGDTYLKKDGTWGTPTDSTKVAKSGDTMSGSLTFSAANINAIKYAGTKETYPMIKFKDNTNDNYGNGIVIGGGGLVVIGGGESSDSVAATHTSGGDEVLDLASDGNVIIWTNVQNGATSADVKKFTFGNDGTFNSPSTIKQNGTAVSLNGHTHNYAGSASAGGQANDSAKLGGASASESATASTIVKRTANSYIYATYYNSNINNENINSYTNDPAIMFTSNDKWIRRTTKANLQTWLGLGSAAYTASTAYAAASHTHNYAGSDSAGGPANVVKGAYTGSGGQKNPNYFGVNKVGFLMMNTTVNSNSNYKDWLIMDCYSGNDVGGAVAIGVNRQALGAYIMRSDAARTSWSASAELLGTHNWSTYCAAKSHTHSYLPLSGGTVTGGTTFTGAVTIKDNHTSGSAYYGLLRLGSGSNYAGGLLWIHGDGPTSSKYHQGISAPTLDRNRTTTLPNSSGTVAWTSSSRRIKENIRNMTDEEAQKILDVGVIKFDYKGDWCGGEKNRSGFIAEDVMGILPETVQTRKDYDPNIPVDEEYNFPPEMDYQRFIPYLVKMVQIQQDEINELKAEIKALKED